MHVFSEIRRKGWCGALRTISVHDNMCGTIQALAITRYRVAAVQVSGVSCTAQRDASFAGSGVAEWCPNWTGIEKGTSAQRRAFVERLFWPSRSARAETQWRQGAINTVSRIPLMFIASDLGDRHGVYMCVLSRCLPNLGTNCGH